MMIIIIIIMLLLQAAVARLNELALSNPTQFFNDDGGDAGES